MDKIKKLNVFYHENKVGTLALYKSKLAAFEYDNDWLKNGFAISPFSIPLEKRVFIPNIDPFDGMFGVFADSLPDGWGRFLVDRFMLKNHILPSEVGNLNRLAIVGASGMGALSYKPEVQTDSIFPVIDLDKIAKECKLLLQTEYSENLDQLFQLGGSSGGARPKILTTINNEEWIIKFPSYGDKANIGKQEYDYSLCARKCGIEMAETKLFPSRKCEGYFGTKRFDRKNISGKNKQKIHMLSVSAILETSHRIPNLDYNLLMKLTLELTKDYSEVLKLYRLMCFNVYAHNRDDHSKNFSYLYDEKNRKWILSPAYDLTYSNSLGGEHATTVNGNGTNPDLPDLLAVAANIGIRESRARSIALEVKTCIHDMLSKYL